MSKYITEAKKVCDIEEKIFELHVTYRWIQEPGNDIDNHQLLIGLTDDVADWLGERQFDELLLTKVTDDTLKSRYSLKGVV